MTTSRKSPTAKPAAADDAYQHYIAKKRMANPTANRKRGADPEGLLFLLFFGIPVIFPLWLAARLLEKLGVRRPDPQPVQLKGRY